MVPKTVYLETFGCQMNVLDSELVLTQLRRLGYEPTADPRQADLALLNTCCVRQHAEQRAFSRLGELGCIKQQRPGLIIGELGCMAQRDAPGIAGSMSYVDVLCGPGRLHELGDLICRAEMAPGRAVAVSDMKRLRRARTAEPRYDDPLEQLDLARDAPGNRAQAYVRVQRGCDKFCSFCVVPHVRGPEQSRPPENILLEVKRLADAGIRQVTLLGQTINSYTFRAGSHTVRLPDLLAMVHEVPGIERIRFITSYPGDFDKSILEAMRNLPKVCEYLHLPAQSGSNRILKMMRRRYSVQQYDDLVAAARQMVPGISLAGDFIVGFPGETDDDFQATCELLLRTAYKNVFVFRYSPRPGTAAARRWVDDVPTCVKGQRNSELLRLQQEISLEQNRRLVGQTVEVLVEDFSKAAIKARAKQPSASAGASWRNPEQLSGRTRGDQIVVFDGPARLVGQLVRITITGATALTLHGRVVDYPACTPSRGS